VVAKGSPARELYDAIRRVSGGDRVLPPIATELMQDATDRLEPDQLPILGMRLHGTPTAEIAATLNVDRAEIERRIDVIIARLRVEVPEIDA
jgi:DNA-binding NarL/FixJ family response regulator